MMRYRLFAILNAVLFCVALPNVVLAQNKTNDARDIPDSLKRWLQPQDWQRDTAGPVLSLGEARAFDDTHIFAPCVARRDGEYMLWYSGSTGAVAQRGFSLGMATSKDGRGFARSSHGPVLKFSDGKRSVLTATLLRDPDGTPIAENGRLRMWFSATDFTDGTGRHALYESTSQDGAQWGEPSEALLEGVYAPTIIKETTDDGEDAYRMWYTDVSSGDWTIRTATSQDGREWDVHPDSVLTAEAEWEQNRLFYPTVLKVDGVYLMWYGSYWSARANTTAIGFAVSSDGIHWHRNPHSPVLTPVEDRAWESHYTTSQSVIRQDDGSFRIWYASRKQPPFVNKYFAINTAIWAGPAESSMDQ